MAKDAARIIGWKLSILKYQTELAIAERDGTGTCDTAEQLRTRIGDLKQMIESRERA